MNPALPAMPEAFHFPDPRMRLNAFLPMFMKKICRSPSREAHRALWRGGSQGGHVLNLSKMNRITGLAKENPEEFLMTVEPGLQLTELNDQLENQTFDTSGWDPSALALLDEFHRSGPWFWPVNPGEVSATIGGIAAQNARGSFVTGYGEPHQFIQRVCLIDGRGKSHAISSGQYRVEKGIQALPDNQRIALGSSAEYATPPNGAPPGSAVHHPGQ